MRPKTSKLPTLTLTLALLTAAAIWLLTPLTASADRGEVFTLDNITYQVVTETDGGEGTVQLGTDANQPVTGRRAINPAAASVSIPEKVIHSGVAYDVAIIAASAFDDCDSLTVLDIPDSVALIADYAINGCEKLAAVNIGSGVGDIGASNFLTCPSLTEINVSERNSAYSSAEGILFSKNKASIVKYPMGKAGSYVIPDTVDRFSSYRVFEQCAELTAVTLGKGLREISGTNFRHCPKLTSLSVAPDHPALSSENGVIFNKAKTTIMAYPCGRVGRYDIPVGVTAIGASAFAYGAALTEVGIPSGVTSVGASAFEYCAALTGATLPPGVTSLGSAAFYNCSKLESVTLPDSLTSIGANAFNSCGVLTGITIPGGVAEIGTSAFSWCYKLAYANMGNGLKTIGQTAFYSCSSLTGITLPDSVVSVGGSAFYNCGELASVSIGSGLASIDGTAFSNCPKLERISVSGANANYSDLDGVLFDKTMTKLITMPAKKSSINIPNTVTSIASSAFENQKGLTYLDIPDSVTDIGLNAFRGCSNLATINVSPGNPKYFSVDGVVFSKDGAALLFCPEGRTGRYDIPSGVTAIGANAFCQSRLTEVTIPSGVASIGDNAFESSVLTSVTIPGSVKTIGTRAFQFSSSLETVALGNGVESIGQNAFVYCSALTGINIPDSVESIGNGAFGSCTNLRALSIGSGVRTIGEAAFNNCTKLANLTIPDGVTSMGASAFAGCGSLIRVSLGRGLTDIRPSSFQNCTGLRNVSIPSTVTRIGDQAFYGCASLGSASIPVSVTTIVNWAFRNCPRLTIYSRLEAYAKTYADANDIRWALDTSLPKGSVTGMVGTYSLADDITLKLAQGGLEYSFTIPTAPGWNTENSVTLMAQPFWFEVIENGSYTLTITKPGHTDLVLRNIIVADGEVDLAKDPRINVQLLAPPCGDINGDRMVNSADLAVLWLSSNYNKNIKGGAGGANIKCDLNGDGLINSSDLTVLWAVGNYNQGNVAIE